MKYFPPVAVGLLALVVGWALLGAGVFILLGLGWALISAAPMFLGLAFVVFRGLTRVQ